MHAWRWSLICLALFTGHQGGLASQRVPVSDIHILVDELNQLTTTDRAARQVFELANKDSGAREYVVHKLPEMINRPESDEVWLNAVRLAGQLKALEAIPALQKAMSRGRPLGGPSYTTSGIQMRLEDDVVAKALSQVGDPAIPCIIGFLESLNEENRRRAVLVLGNIKSPAARKALQVRLPNESEPAIRQMIRNVLRSGIHKGPVS